MHAMRSTVDGSHPPEVRARAPIRVWLLAGVVLLVLGACSSRPPTPPRVALSACTLAGSIAARCGRVLVPQDWAHPDGAQLPLWVAVVPATDPQPARDPLFYLAGFGGAATQDASWALQTFKQLHAARDLVFVDQRGTGSSGRQTCTGFLPDTGTKFDAAALRVAVQRCLASAARDPRHDTTAAAVRDLDRVRVALGYDHINLYGGSYGVSAGLAYLQRYGSHVRTAVFDSGSLLDVPLWQLVPTSAQQAFDQLARRCARTPVCAASNNPQADLATVVRRLRAHPASVVAPVGAGQQTITIDLPGFLNFVIDGYLARPQTAVLLPADLHTIARGDWSTVLRRRADLIAAVIQASSAPTQLQQITIRCSDTWAAMSLRDIAAQATRSLFTAQSLHEAELQRAICTDWPHDPGVSGTVTSSAPVVFLNGSADPADPPGNVAAAPDAAHGVVTEGCLPTLVTRFIQSAQPTDRADWAACAWPSSLPAFSA
jgi:pimeloyl-ACP methyl ester carboxylesterase